ncbi:FliI/YscN family ATPase [Dyella sp. Tek66A03]|uniref:FliI/YscN family ATPase n=1 Tax=Dyella sp. Tek66A03 TaxID=3458298 RepID=UPI00403E7792
MTPGTVLWRSCAHPDSIVGSIIRVRLPQVAVGELCEVRKSAASTENICEGVVVALDDGVASVSLFGDSRGLSSNIVVVPTGGQQRVEISSALLGGVMDGFGRCVDRLCELVNVTVDVNSRHVNASAVDYRSRLAVDEPFSTGIRAIDALLSTGVGQRMGIFAAAGAGKTTLSEMLIDHAKADVYVIALVGERGREVASFVERARASSNAARTIIVQAASDTAPATRCNAAMLATAVAEYFRDQGARVLLVMDSMTRYARALRDVALAAGEPPARRGYPASVFEALPKLVERPGRTLLGSVTAFYTVLLEDEEDADPVGEELKSLLDGHIYLSARLAGRGHFPAIDLLRSGSRLFNQLANPDQQNRAQRLRSILGLLADMQLMRDLGEYKPGSNAQHDTAVENEEYIHAFLRQSRNDYVDFNAAMRSLNALAI